MFVLEPTSIRMNDKLSLVPLLNEHQALFGEGILKSVSADKGYKKFTSLREGERVPQPRPEKMQNNS